MEEYFDILDDNGNKTGKTKPRKDVHHDGDWHKSVHIWILNNNGDVLLQRRCATKESNPNMLSISSAGHLSSGDDSLTGAIREIKEELGIDIDPNELKLIKTLKFPAKDAIKFNNNEFNDLYILRTNLTTNDMTFQQDEISEIFFVTYKKFKKMVSERNKELVMYDDEFKIIFDLFDSKFDNSNKKK